MKKIYISDSGPKVSEAIYGFWRWENVENATAKMEKIVNLCLDLGINTFDHSDMYGDFTAEETFGKILSQKAIKRDEIVLFSKCGVRKTANGTVFYDNSKKYVEQSIENSLRNLKTDFLDIFLLNQSDHLADPEATAVMLDQIVSSGKAKHIGIANFNVFQHQLLASYLNKPIVTNHIELNLMNISAIEDGRLDFIKQSFSKPLAWAPLAGGEILDGKNSKSLILNQKLAEIGQKYDANIEQTAVAWIMQLGTLPIIGSLSEDRIKNAASASNIKLSQEDWYEIYNLSKA